MPRLKAYLLAADPTWIERSVESYYDIVEQIVVSYDAQSVGWTGHQVAVDECLRRLRAIDRDGKMTFHPGAWHPTVSDPMMSETRQRRDALRLASDDADWVLQIDTDELLPSPAALLTTLAVAEARGVGGVEWPMRVLFRKLSESRFLEVCTLAGGDRFDYPGPIAVRPDVDLVEARRIAGGYLRPIVRTDAGSLQLATPPSDDEHRVECLDLSEAIVHNSWAREPREVWRKISTWGHNNGWRSRDYYFRTWLPSAAVWRWQRDLHPFASGLWPKLRPLETSASQTNLFA